MLPVAAYLEELKRKRVARTAPPNHRLSSEIYDGPFKSCEYCTYFNAPLTPTDPIGTCLLYQGHPTSRQGLCESQQVQEHLQDPDDALSF